MSPDPIYADPRLALLYDAFEAERDDLDPYLRIADELGARTVIDVGCGTGVFAAMLADTGRAVIGVDPAAASLDIARSRDSRVTWVHGTAEDLPAVTADLAVMTANVAQVFLTDDDWARTLHAVHRVLRPGGHLVFETRRPERRAWVDWAADTRETTVDVPGIGPVTSTIDVTDISLPLVSFRHTYRFPDATTLSSDSTLRFRSRDEIEASLVGYRVSEVRDAPDRPGREYVFLAERTG